MLAVCAGTGSARALDAQDNSSTDVTPREMFTLGFNAYKRGQKVEAFEALRFAADKGHAGARWKLGQMYASGDGVPENDYEAFQMFERIIRDQEDDTATSPNAAYVSSALVALADYFRKGIPGTPVAADPAQARALLSHAASYFGDPRAQFELGRMLVAGEGGKPNARQGARWLKLASHKGYSRAEALLGYLIFDGKAIAIRPEPVRGLAMLTRAMRDATAEEREWIRPLQEEAFSLSDEEQRRTALAFSQADGPLIDLP
ncbi:tetratricopeptide repeat protein [Aureimonas frigidaquae]|uniref:Putative exopolysaccharide production negative regulator n=1 Tax=Aureimonas frigidaquae TaxID=424757 RepID=A0A0P0Z4E2_9HYPH|nr:tetratricopeptide repeat protein [Aureimonas frigidaquae]BAT28984.1 putative exopolysaccharide production negative regulator [Aureimonas frigidaquae]